MSKIKKVIGIIVGLVGIGVIVLSYLFRPQECKHISVIGGADGPTSIFLAGKAGSNYSIYGFILGGILLVVAVVCAMKRDR